MDDMTPYYNDEPEMERYSEELDTPLLDKVFVYIMDLQQAALQLKMNHWQTQNYAEHKTTDKFVNVLRDYADKIAETAMGEYQRPKIETTHLNVTDISMTSTRWVLDTVRDKTNNMISELKTHDSEGLLAVLGDFDADFKKAVYLSTLE